MSFYIFKKTGDYQGIRLTRPTDQETDLIGIESTPENLAKMSVYVTPKLIDGEIVETATPEEIEQHNRSKVPASVSSLRFWLAVLDTIGITKQYIISHVEQLEDIGMRTRIMVMLSEAQEFDRSNPFLNQMANMLGIDQALLDQIFITASNYQL